MSSSFAEKRVIRYESAAELREANVQLMEALNRLLKQDESPEGEQSALRTLEAEIRAFLERGAATGSVVVDVGERTACQVLLDYWVSALSHAAPNVLRARLADFDKAQLPDLKDRPCPYAGLEAFHDQKFFFGREKAIESLLERVASTPLVVVQGIAGSGKSSIVNGGVLPLLRGKEHDPHYRVVGPFSPGNAVLERFAEALSLLIPHNGAEASAKTASLRTDPEQLVRMLNSTRGDPILLVIDQFGEVFTLSSESDRRAFSECVDALLKASDQNRVLLTLGEEFSARLDELVALRPYLALHARFSMSDWPMGYEDLLAAVEKPAAAVNLQFEAGIVDAMVKSVLASRETALSLLQFALNLLWARRDRNQITKEIYEGIGGSPQAALIAYADAFLARLRSDIERDEAARMLTELIFVDRLLAAHRQPMLRRDLQADGASCSSEVLEALAEYDFVRLTPTSDGQDEVVEVKHEALLRNWPTYQVWIDAKRERVRQRVAVSEAAQTWDRGGRSTTKNLLTGWQLQEVVNLSGLTSIERDYIRVSRRAVESAGAKRTRLIVGTTAIGLAFVGGLAWMYVDARQARKAEQQQVLLRTMATAREAAINGKFDRAIHAGLQATAGVPGVSLDARSDSLLFEQRVTLLSVLQSADDIRRFFVDSSAVFQAVAFHPTHPSALVVYGGTTGKAYVAGISETESAGHINVCGNALVTSIAFEPKGRWLAAGCANGTVSVWSTDSAKWEQLGETWQVSDRTIWSIAFSRDGRLLAAGGFDSQLKFNALGNDGVPSRHSLPLPRGDEPKGSIWSLAFSPSEDTLLVGDGIGQVLRCSPEIESVAWQCKASGNDSADKGNAIRALAFNPSGTRVAVGHWDGRVEILDQGLSPQSRQSVDVSQAPGAVYSLAFFENCGLSHLAVGKGDRLHYFKVTPMFVGPPPPGRCIDRPYASIGNEAYGIAVHKPSGLIAAATRGGYVAVINPAGEPERLRAVIPFATKPGEQVRAAAIAEDTNTTRLVVAVNPALPDAPNLAVLTLRSGGPPDPALRSLSVGKGAISRVSASPEARVLATLSRLSSSGEVAVWRFKDDFQGVEQLYSLGTADFNGFAPKRIALSPDGKWLAVSLGPVSRAAIRERPSVEAWCERNALASKILIVPVDRPDGRASLDTNLCSGQHDIEIAFDSDSKAFVAGGDANRVGEEPSVGLIQAWSVTRSTWGRLGPDMRMTPLANTVSEVALARREADSQSLAAGGQYGEIDLWQLGSSHTRQFRIDSSPVWLLAFGPSGSGLAASDARHVIRVMDVNRPESQPLRLTPRSDVVGTPGFLAFAGNGRWLASGSWSQVDGGAIHLWDFDVASLRSKLCALVRRPGEHGAEISDSMGSNGYCRS